MFSHLLRVIKDYLVAKYALEWCLILLFLVIENILNVHFLLHSIGIIIDFEWNPRVLDVEYLLIPQAEDLFLGLNLDEQLHFGPESRINEFLQQSLLQGEQAPLRFNFCK